jgi:hypothetical protein
VAIHVFGFESCRVISTKLNVNHNLTHLFKRIRSRWAVHTRSWLGSLSLTIYLQTKLHISPNKNLLSCGGYSILDHNIVLVLLEIVTLFQ